MSKGISIRVAGAEDGALGDVGDGAEGGVAVEKTRKMIPHKKLLCRPRLLRAHTGQRDAACGEAAIALRPGRPALRAGGSRRPQQSRWRRLLQGNAAGHAHGTWQWQGARHWQP
eukprot:6190948-Pleurochrysis_carterae.AAC.1